MTENATNEEPAKSRRSRKRRANDNLATTKRTGRVAAGLALILSIMAALVSGYVGYLVHSKRGLADAKGRLVNVEQETAELASQGDQLTQEIAGLRERQGSLAGAVKSLNEEIGKGRRAWLLAETENLMVIAQHRLAYARDTRLALEALRAADRQLVQLGDPDFQPVRKQLGVEIAALEAYAENDLAGLAQRLGRIANRLEKLPLAPTRTDESADRGIERGILEDMWSDIKDLVRVRHTDATRRPFLIPEHKYFLRENLRLMLYGAELALLHGDRVNFELNARRARQWLGDYYDATNPEVTKAQSDIDAALRSFAVALPDLTASLVKLREFRGRQGGT